MSRLFLIPAGQDAKRGRRLGRVEYIPPESWLGAEFWQELGIASLRVKGIEDDATIALEVVLLLGRWNVGSLVTFAMFARSSRYICKSWYRYVSNVEHEANDKKGGKGSPTAIPGLNNAG